MKTLTNTFILLLALVCTAHAGNDEKFYRALGQAVTELYQAENPQELTVVLNKISRIKQAEAKRWEPVYYQAFGYIKMAQMAQDASKADTHLDQALALVAEGSKLSPGNAELVALQGYALMMKLTLDPVNRGAELSPRVFAAMQKALAIDPANPRAWFLLGQMQLGTAKFMGSGTEEGCASLQNAVKYFAENKPATPVAPAWGANAAETAVKECK